MLSISEDEIDSLISQTNSLRGALFAIRNNLDMFGGCNLAYEHMVRAKAHIRGDLITMTTLTQAFTDLYYPSGGTNNDPILDLAGSTTGLIKLELADVVRDVGSKFYANAFFSALLQNGVVSISSYSVIEAPLVGHMVLTVFETEEQSQVNLDLSTVLKTFTTIRRSLQRHGQLRRYFNLTEVECLTLQRTADGRSGDDISSEQCVSRRTVEIRLQSARKKLHAQSSTEAVYKALAYGILPFTPSNDGGN